MIEIGGCDTARMAVHRICCRRAEHRFLREHTSRIPSLFTSLTAIAIGYVPVGELIGLPKLPFPSPRSTETDLVGSETPALAVAISKLPSPLKSPIATDTGPLPATIWMAGWNVPSGLPNSTKTVLSPRLPQRDRDSHPH